MSPDLPKRESTQRGKVIWYKRIDNIQKAWKIVKENAGIEDLQLKDLRTYFNYHLKSVCGFTTKEAAAYLGNSEEINDRHYSPVSVEVVRRKLKSLA
jgi:hypothetical protein